MPRDWEPPGESWKWDGVGSTHTWAHLALLCWRWLQSGAKKVQPRVWKHSEGNKCFFPLFPLLFAITAAQGEPFQGPMPLPASLPNPRAVWGGGIHRHPVGGWDQEWILGQRNGSWDHGVDPETVRLVPTAADTYRDGRVLCWGCSMRGRGAVGSIQRHATPRILKAASPGCSLPCCGPGWVPLLLPVRIHLRDPVDERLLPGRDMATVPRVLGTGELQGKSNRERRSNRETQQGQSPPAAV